MKRCIICGNIRKDDSTVCEVCGNPYIDLEEDTPYGETTELAEGVLQAEAASEGQASSGEEEMRPEEDSGTREPEHASVEEVRKEERGRAPEQPGSVHRMKSGPQIYGQENGVQTMRGVEPVGAFRRDINGGGYNAGASGAPGGSQPAAARAAQGQRRPAARPGSSANGQRRPMNEPARAMNGQGSPMNGPARAMNGQGSPMNGPARAMNGQGGPMRAAGAPNNRIRSVSRMVMCSPILILTALLQTVCLGGSVAAIFMKELNFSQMLRLVSGLVSSTQLGGYTDQLLKLMAKLDTDAVVANLVMLIPDLLVCIGLWAIVAAARTKEEEMSGLGFTLIKIVVIIGLVKNSILLVAGLIISVALVVSAWVSGVQSAIIAGVATVAIMIVLAMLVIMYYFCYIAMLHTFRSNALDGESYGSASGYVAAVYVLMGLFGIIGLLSGIVNSEISGIVQSVGKIGWMLLFAVWIFRYRSKLSEVED